MFRKTYLLRKSFLSMWCSSTVSKNDKKIMFVSLTQYDSKERKHVIDFTENFCLHGIYDNCYSDTLIVHSKIQTVNKKLSRWGVEVEKC